MMLSPDGPPALPCWINGRAFLTMTPDFFEVRHAQTGKPLRRTPLCGADEVAEAVNAAQAALPAWGETAQAERQAMLARWADGLDQYAGHFAGLIQEETGKTPEAAAAEVAAALAALRTEADGVQTGMAGKVLAVVSDAAAPLAQAAQLFAPVLLGGGALVFKPSPRAPGAAFALVELSGRLGLPAGLVNLVQGDDAALEALCTHAGIERLIFAGQAELASRVASRADAAGKPFSCLDFCLD